MFSMESIMRQNNINKLFDERHIDSLDYMVISKLAKCPIIKYDINKIYNANKIAIIPCYLNSPIHKSNVLDTIPIEIATMVSKVAGIFYWSLQNKNNSIRTLAFKSIKPLSQSYKLNKSFNRNCIMSFVRKILESTSSVEKGKLSLENLDNLMVAFRVSNIYNIPCYKLEDIPLADYEPLVALMFNSLQYYRTTIDELKLDLDINLAGEEYKLKAFKDVWSLRDLKIYEYGYLAANFSVSEMNYRSVVLSKKRYPEIPEELKDNFFSIVKGIKAKDRVSPENISRLLVSINTEKLGYKLYEVAEETLSKEEVDKILSAIIIESEAYPIPWEIVGYKVITYIRNFILNRDYNKARNIALKEKQLEFVEQYEEILKGKDGEINKLRLELDKVKKKEGQYKSQITTLTQSLKEITKENRKLCSEMEKVKEHKKELEALRELVKVDTEVEEQSLTELDREEMLECLNSKNLVIIGGHERWVVKMKPYFPNAIWLNPDSQNRDMKFLSEGEHICIFNTQTNSHGVAYKVLPLIERNDNAKLVMIKNFGIDRTIKYVYDFVTKN